MRPKKEKKPFYLYTKQTKKGPVWYAHFWDDTVNRYAITRSTGIPAEGKKCAVMTWNKLPGKSGMSCPRQPKITTPRTLCSTGMTDPGRKTKQAFSNQITGLFLEDPLFRDFISPYRLSTRRELCDNFFKRRLFWVLIFYNAHITPSLK
jgi:hypothetical protein